jgi:hypothetical protein
MRFIKWLFWVFVIFVVLPAIFTVALLKYTATPLTNWLLSQKVNAPAKVEKVETNWLLTQFKVLNLEIDNPKGFEKGKLLHIPETDVNLDLKTYITFQPFLQMDIKKLYFHFERKSDNSTNVAVAFNLPYQKGNVSPLKFNIHDTDIKVNVQTLKDVKYQTHGRFEGFYNDAEFVAKGYGDLSREKPFTHTEFTVYNWKITKEQLENLYKKAPVIQPIVEQLKQTLGIKELVFSKIWGIVETKGDLLLFQGLKFYITDKLVAEIQKGSTYNRLTKTLNVKGTIYIPTKVEFTISGTTEKPKIEIKNLEEIMQKNLKNLLQSNKSEKQNKLLEKVKKPVEETLEKAKQEIEKAKEKIQQLLPIH